MLTIAQPEFSINKLIQIKKFKLKLNNLIKRSTDQKFLFLFSCLEWGTRGYLSINVDKHSKEKNVQHLHYKYFELDTNTKFIVYKSLVFAIQKSNSTFKNLYKLSNM